MNKYELFPGVYANHGQTEALDLLYAFLKSDDIVFMLCGRGGTGKTTIIKKVIENYPGNIGGIAISHKAKKVLGVSIGQNKVMTVASALCIKLNEHTGEFSPDLFKRKDPNNIPITKMDLIIVDEASMISDEIIKEIKEFKKKGAKIIFVGDDAQLPPVGKTGVSSVFNIKNNYILTEKMRQASTSPIINIGELINDNQKAEETVLRALTSEDRVNMYDPVSESSVLFESDENKVLDMFVEDFNNCNGDTDYCKMVTFNNENHKHPQSVKNLNAIIRSKIWGDNPEDYYVGEILTAYDSFYKSEMRGKTRSGKPIRSSICVFNNSEDFTVCDVSDKYNKQVNLEFYDSRQGKYFKLGESFECYDLSIVNNDTRDIETVPVLSSEGKIKFQETLVDLWKNCKKLYYDAKAQFANLLYGYAITSHKAQGSSYTNCYVFEDNILGNSNGSSVEAKNQSLYVAVSRPRKKLVILSSVNKSQEKEELAPKVVLDTPVKVNYKKISKDALEAVLFDNSGEIIVSMSFDEGVKTKKFISKMLFYKADITEGKYNIRITNQLNEFVEFKEAAL